MLDDCKTFAEFASACVVAQIATDWVHVSETRMTGRHFSVSAMNTAAPIAAE